MKTTRRNAKFNETQVAYFLARAAYETAREACAAEKKALGLVVTRETSDEECERIFEAEEEVAEKHDVYRLRDVLTKAERAMVDWSAECAIKLAPSKAAEIRETVEKAFVRPAMWSRCVDLAARLSA